MEKLFDKAVSQGAVVGILVGFDDNNAPLVDHPDNPSKTPLPARSTVALQTSDSNRDAVLLFENNDPSRPIIVGLLHDQPVTQTIEAEVDDDVLTIEGKRQIVLRCGKASITLTSAGKVLIQGEYVSSRSAGVNKVKGASVHLN